jgi:hypothetical protein
MEKPEIDSGKHKCWMDDFKPKSSGNKVLRIQDLRQGARIKSSQIDALFKGTPPFRGMIEKIRPLKRPLKILWTR